MSIIRKYHNHKPQTTPWHCSVFLHHCSVFFHNGTKNGTVCFCTTEQKTEQCVFVPLFRFLHHCSVFSTTEQKTELCVFVPLFRFLHHCSVFPQQNKKRNSVFLYHCSVFCTTVPFFPQRNKKRNSVFLYHCSVFFTVEQKNGTVCFCTTVPFFAPLFRFFHNGTKNGTVCFCTTVPFFAPLFRFFHNGTKTGTVCFCTTVPFFAPLFRFFHNGTKNGTVCFCTTVPFFAPLFRFFHNGTKTGTVCFCTTVPFFTSVPFSTTEQKRNGVLLYHCSVFCTTVPFLHYCSILYHSPVFLHRFAIDIMDYESRKLLCHPKDIVSSLRDRVLKETDGDESIDMPKSEDADNSRVLRAKLLASSDSIAFSAKLGVLVIADQTAIYTVRLYPTESCTCPIKRNCIHILGVKIGQRMTINEEDLAIQKNTAVVRKNTRPTKQKPGRKRPRPGDISPVQKKEAKIDLDQVVRGLEESRIQPVNDSQLILKAKFSNVYMQTNGNDCGLYAIANATALAFGRDPSKEQYIPSKLREHLIQCLENKEMRPFPTAKGTSKRRKAIKKTKKLAVILCLQNAWHTH